MSHRMLGWGALLSAGLLLLLPVVSEAQVRVGVGVGVQRGNVGIYYGNAPGYRGYSPGYGYGYGSGYGYGYPYGYPAGRSGLSISIGSSPYYSGYGYAPYYGNRYYTPYVPDYGYNPYYYGTAPTYIVQPQTRAMYPPAVQPMPRVDNTAHLEVHVPAGAKVWMNDTEMTMSGPVRRFYSPELEPGYNYSYTIRATWTDNGQPVTQERKVAVQAGGRFQVDLTGDALPTPRKNQP